jgi:preprotein translocase subunit SecB
MKTSPLQLERYYLTELQFEANDALELKETPPLNLESVVGIGRHNQDERRYKVQLKVLFGPAESGPIPQKGSVTFTGYFAVDIAVPMEKVQMLVETNAPSVLFGAAREMFCNLTARGPWGMVTLPSQSFYKSAPASTPPKALCEDVAPAVAKPA